MASSSPTIAQPQASGSPSPRASGSPRSGALPRQADSVIENRIEEACRALWWAELTRTLLILFIAIVSGLLVWMVIDQWIYSPGRLIRCVVWIGGVVAVVGYVFKRIVPLLSSRVRPEYAARSLERDLPELRQALTTYVTLRDDVQHQGLASRVLRSMGASTAGRLKKYDRLPAEATGTFRWWMIAIAAIALLAGYLLASPKSGLQSTARLMAPLADIAPPHRVEIYDVQPGNTTAIAGREVSVSARVTGLRPGEQIVCYWDTPSGRRQTELVSKDDETTVSGNLKLRHTAGGTIPYWIHAGDATAGPFYLRVQDVPVVALESVHYQPPQYTGQTAHSSSNGSIRGIDGTRVTITATTNRPVEGGKIEFNPRAIGNRIQATAGAVDLVLDSDQTTATTTFLLRAADGRSAAVQYDSYRIVVWDSSGQFNPDPVVYPIRVIPDLPPEVSITLPRTNPKDIPVNAQQAIEVHASDPDFGLQSVVLEIRSRSKKLAAPILFQDDDGAKGNQVVEYPFRPAQWDLQPGDTLTVIAIATDNRRLDEQRAGHPNQSRSDPLQLRIVAPQDLPSEEQASNDGLSRPNETPDSSQDESSNAQSDASEASGSSNQSQGGNGGGASGQQSSGQSDGAGQGGQGASSEPSNADNQSGEGGQSSEGGGQSADNPSGSSQSDSSSSSGGSTDTGSSNDSSSDTQRSGANNSAASNEGAPSDATSADGQPNHEQTDQPQTDQPQTGAENTGAENTGAENTGAETAGAENTGAQNTGAETNGANGGRPQSTGNQSDGTSTDDSGSTNQQPDGDLADDSQSPPRPPQHDGEAFERIRNFLEQKRDASAEPASGSQSDSTAGSQENESQKTPSQDAGAQDAGAQDAGAQDAGAQDAGAQDAGAQGEGTRSESTQEHPRPSSEEPGDQSSGSDASTSENTSSPESASSESTNPETGDPSGSPDATDGQSSNTSSRSDQQSGSPNGTPDQNDGTGNDQSNSSGDTDESQNSEPTESDAGSSTERSSDQPQGSSASDEEGTQQSDPTQRGSSDNESADARANSDDSADGSEQETDSDSNRPSDTNTSQQPSGSDSPQSQSNRPDAGDQGGPSESSNSTDRPAPDASEPPTQSTSNQGPQTGRGDTGTEGAGIAGDAPQPPDPADLEYARKATDLVLDYLNQTRDAPDQELLDELNWTADDLRRFAERWQRVRELSDSNLDPESQRQINEALQSLGMRSRTPAADRRGDSSDSLRAIRDAGNRKPPPPAFRDAFDAFRRAVNQNRKRP